MQPTDSSPSRVDDQIGLLGDAHGNFVWTRSAIEQLLGAGVRQIHALGDFGFVWHGSPREHHLLGKLDAVLAAHDGRLLVTGGNHEGYSALERFFPADAGGYRRLTERIIFLPRGWRGRTASGTVIASLGGANSIDRWLRKAPDRESHGGSWWPQEQITDNDLATLGTEPVSILLGHDAPRSRALADSLDQAGDSWRPAEVAYAEAGQRMFQRGVEQVKPQLVISGHYHQWVDTTETFRPAGGEEFVTRSVILDCDGAERSIAVLDVDDLVLRVLNRQ